MCSTEVIILGIARTSLLVLPSSAGKSSLGTEGAGLISRSGFNCDVGYSPYTVPATWGSHTSRPSSVTTSKFRLPSTPEVLGCPKCRTETVGAGVRTLVLRPSFHPPSYESPGLR